jgi:GDP/UDP-N,N'-diacetylbacillosamine 2-epimerase (hydrolysing)
LVDTRVEAMGKPLRKIAYLSGTRADFGLMKSTLLLLAPVADLGVAVTGMHLDDTFGRTVDEIRECGLRICGEVPIDVVTRTGASMSAGIGHCLSGLTGLLQREQPDILLLLGDRGEMLAGAIAALHLGIVSVHIHGGERSGTVDEPVRHAISKLASYHLVATEQSRERLIRMGELPERVVVTGAPGIDEIAQYPELSLDHCTRALGLPAGQPFVLALFHPVVQQSSKAYPQTASLLQALKQVGLPVIWAEPNADAGSKSVLQALHDFELPFGSQRVRHLHRPLFCSAMKHCAVMVGNSSSGIIEAASFGTPVVNVGDRQRLRERNANVTDVETNAPLIFAALKEAIKHGKWPCTNKYGDGGAGPRIAEKLLTLPLDRSVLEKVNTY